jgi:hypothetical protein
MAGGGTTERRGAVSSGAAVSASIEAMTATAAVRAEGAGSLVGSARRCDGVRALVLVVVTAAILFAGCGVDPVQVPGARPADAVRGAVERIVAHDLPGGTRFTCVGQRDPRDFPFIISGIFSPVGSVPTPSLPETLALISIDTRDLRLEDAAGDLSGVTEAEVQLSGSLWLTLDPEQTERAVRAAVLLQNDPLDEALLAQTLAAIRSGPIELPVDQVVRVVREAGEWRVCDPLPVN